MSRELEWCHELMRNSYSAMALLDARLTLTRVSAPLEIMLGANVGELLGQNMNVLVRNREGGSVQSIISDSAAMGTSLPGLSVCRGGSEVPVSIRAVKLDGEAGGWFVILSDLTQQTQFDRLKSDFVSIVSHELRTPLSSIAGALGLVSAGAAGDVSEDASEMIGIALNNTNRLIRLIDDLLDVERIESGRLHFDMQCHSLGALLRTAIQEIKPFADRYKVALQFEKAEGSDCVHVDSDRTVQVFTNLLSNAIKFSPADGQVTIRLFPKPAYHRIEFIDNGPGIPEGFRKRIFTKFAQADGSGSRRVGGTGLGLAISRQIVDRLDGKLWFADNPQGGTIFYMDLPAASAEHGVNNVY
jgi:signal transduction histidine kinase